jgi:aspartyl-tRNA(Asn)/glutamyl-tRNA(Gln) amidotransferase subunit C
MFISKDELSKLMNLSKLDFSENELNHFAQRLENVIDTISTLQDVNTDGAQPLRSVFDMPLRMREDIVTDENIQNQIFANVPSSSKQMAENVKCFIVPKVVE